MQRRGGPNGAGHRVRVCGSRLFFERPTRMRGRFGVRSRGVRRVLRGEQGTRYGVTVGSVAHIFKPRSELVIRKVQDNVEQAEKHSTCRACGRQGPPER